VKKLYSIRKKLLQQWKSTMMSQIKTNNQKHKSKIFNKNNLILLLMKNLNQKCSSKKLLHKFAKSFHINKSIKKQIYHLYLSVIYWIHNVFHEAQSHSKIWLSFLNKSSYIVSFFALKQSSEISFDINLKYCCHFIVE